MTKEYKIKDIPIIGTIVKNHPLLRGMEERKIINIRKENKMKTKYKYRLAVNEIVWAKVRQLQKTKKFKSVNRTIEYLLNKKGGTK